MDNYKQYYYMWVSLMGEMSVKADMPKNFETLKHEGEVANNVLVRMAQMQAAYIMEV